MTDAKICCAPIKTIDLSYQMGTHHLFHKLNATFMPGITAIVGENGCGKSTLLRLLSGTNRPTSGRILYQDNPIRPPIGYVPNIPFLYSYMTVLENLFFIGKLKKIDPLLFNNQLALTLQRCNLSAWQNCLFGQLSDGLKKRTCIASALLHDPHLLIFDEPCSELDPLQRESLWTLFQFLRAQGKSIIFSSHHVTEIQPLCDQLLLLNHGQLTKIANQDLSSLDFFNTLQEKTI